METFLSEIHSQILDPDRFPVAMLAIITVIIVGIVTGPMHGNANPFFWKLTGQLLGGIGGRLDRAERKASDLLFRGFFVTMLGLVLSYLTGMLAVALVQEMYFYGITEIILLSLTLTGGAVWYALLKLYFALKENKVGEGAYYTIARSTLTDLSGSDDFGITRTGMGFAARSFDKGLVAPVLWYLIAGLPGAFLYAGLAALSWRFGKEGFTKGFGSVALALERLMGFVPMLLSGVLMALAGLFTPTGGMTRAFVGLLQEKGRARYEQGGLPLTAMARSLNVSLGGPSHDLDGSAIKRDWIGPDGATAQLESGHLRRVLYISLMAHLLFLASLMGGMLWAGNLLF